MSNPGRLKFAALPFTDTALALIATGRHDGLVTAPLTLAARLAAEIIRLRAQARKRSRPANVA